MSSETLIIALFRCWERQRRCGREPMPAMMQVVDGYGYDLTLVPICDSFFALTESCIGRPLRSGPLFALTEPVKGGYQADEQGLLAMVQESTALSATAANTAIPHGLPGALCWAAKALVRVLGGDVRFEVAEQPEQPAHCPFAADRARRAAAQHAPHFRLV